MRYLVLLFMLSGCVAVSKPAYFKNVETFGRSTRSLSYAPGDLYQQVSDFRFDLRLLSGATVFSSEEVIASLDKSVEFKKAFEENVTATYDACNIIGAYSEALLALIDESYQRTINDETADLGVKLNTAVAAYNKRYSKRIPKTAGGFVASVINEIGSMKLKKLQQKYLKEFVDSGSVIINTVCDFLTAYVATGLERELSTLDRQFKNNMLSFYDNIQKYQEKIQVNPYNYLKEYNPIYLRMKERLENIRLLYDKTMASVKNIKTAHDAINTAIATKAKRGPDEQTDELYAGLREVNRILKKLNATKDSF